MDNLNPGKENKNLDAIRHFKGTWKNFEEFWKSKGARMSPCTRLSMMNLMKLKNQVLNLIF